MARHAVGWWAKRVEELSRGGGAEEIARRHGVRPRTLLWWRSELARRARDGGAPEPGPQLLPVVVARPGRSDHQRESPAPAGVEVVVDVGAMRITARGDLRPEHLAAMIAAARPC